jgi:hypothetical protein
VEDPDPQPDSAGIGEPRLFDLCDCSQYFLIVFVIVVVVIDRSRVHVHMPMSYRASKGTPIAPQHTGNNGCKSWGLVDRFGGF